MTMPLQAGITIAGLGSGAPGSLTLGAWEALRTFDHVYLRTGEHPVVEWLVKEGISFQTFDHIYEEEPTFEKVYARIARSVLEEGRKEPVLYAVPGHPLVAEESVRLIIAEAEQEGLTVKLLSAVSFLDDLFTALRLDPGKGLQVIDGTRIEEMSPIPARGAVITQVYSRRVASDVKLALLEIYPAGHQVTMVKGAGIPGAEKIEVIPLFEMDRLKWIDHLTSLYIPGIPQSDRGEENGAKAAELRVNQALNEHEERHFHGQAFSNDSDAGQAAGLEVFQVYRGEVIKTSKCSFPLDPLVDILAQLRGERGCPWDREQDHRSLRTYLIEETYELLEALDEEDMYKICEELGDLLLQIVFHAQIAAENRHFDMNDVVSGITGKMVRRHPHVFGTVTVQDSSEVTVNWEKIKVKERGKPNQSLLDGVQKCLPSLMRSAKLQEKAASVGFDWPDFRGALEKTYEELSELESVIKSGNRVQIEKEMGDLIFSAVNLARLLGVEPETALSGTVVKFIKRFSFVEKMAELAGRDLEKCSLSEMDKWWEDAKKHEKI